MPVPERVVMAGEFVALLLTVTLPVTLPAEIDSKVIFKVVDCPGVRVVPEGTPPAVKPAPAILMFEIAMLEFPEFVSFTGRVLLTPVFRFPKLKLVGLALSRYVAAFTVRVAGLLATLPAELLITTVKCAPLSDVVV